MNLLSRITETCLFVLMLCMVASAQQVKGVPPQVQYIIPPEQAVSCGSNANYVICQDGTLQSWGYNASGELGRAVGNTTDSNIPVAVVSTALNNVTYISGGNRFVLAINNIGRVYGWGENGNRQVGNNSTTDRTTPIIVSNAISTFTMTAVAGGGAHSLALQDDGTVWAWGANSSGQCGINNTTTPQGIPVHVLAGASGCATNLCNITKIAAGTGHSLALKSDGTLWAWGYNVRGQLGDGSTTTALTPIQVTAIPGGRTITQIAAGWDFSAALCSDGTVWTWGFNSRGQLGDGTISSCGIGACGSWYDADKTTPVQVVAGGSSGTCGTYLCNIKQITTTPGLNEYFLALDNNGKVWTWGESLVRADNSCGTSSGSPSQVVSTTCAGSLSNVIAIGSGQQHGLAYYGGNGFRTWGQGFRGELGDGTNTFTACCPVNVIAPICYSILPVKIVSFTGRYEFDHTVLDWSTASELNNDYFSVERSWDGENWTGIGTVKGAGNSSVENKYSFTDESLDQFLGRSVAYYRLKQIDFNGEYEYFGPISVSLTPADEWDVVFQNHSSGNDLQGTLFVPQDAVVRLDIVDLQGRVLKQERFDAAEGSNFLSVNLSGITKGVYLIKVYDNNHLLVRKIVRI